jgi:uncharacterized protein YuzE
MNVTIGNLTFDQASYDADGDVLYLHVGERQAAVDSEQTPEGHVLRFGADGQVIGLTIVNARWLLERDGELVTTRHDCRAACRKPPPLRGRLSPCSAFPGSVHR